MFWNLFLVDCLPPIHLVLFGGISPVLLFGPCFCVPHFECLSQFFCILGRSALSPHLGSRFPVGLGGTVSLITWTRFSRNVPYVGYLRPTAVVEYQLFLTRLWAGLTHRLTDCENWPWPHCTDCCSEADPIKWICPSRVWCLLQSPFWCAACGSNWCVLWYHLKPITVCIGSGATWEILVQISIRCCLWLTLDFLFGATKWSTVCGFLWWTWLYMGGAKLYTKATSTIIEPWGKVINRPKYLQTWLHLPVPANCLLETLSPGSLAVCEMNDILSESTGRCDLCSSDWCADSNSALALHQRTFSKGFRVHQG